MRRPPLSVAAVAMLLFMGCGDDAPASDGGVDADAAPPDAEADTGVVDAGPPPDPRPATAPLTQWVDPFIAAGGIGYGVGSAYPGPARPFGMVHVSPDTVDADNAAVLFAHCAGYAYDDTHVRGFSHTHPHGMGASDYGAVMLMPTLGMSADKTSSDGYYIAMDKESEEASPGYYAVTLADGVRVELTTERRVALHRYTFPAGSDAVVLSDLAHHITGAETIDGEITVDPDAGELSGFARVSAGYSGRFGGVPVYFVMRFSRPFETSGVWQDGTLYEGETTRTGVNTGAWVRFDTSADTVVEAAVGISFVDVAHARMNLDTEMPAIDFDGTRAAADAAWEALLSRIEIEARTEREFRMFYTAVYHTLLMPTLAMDVDGTYRGIDQEVHVADGFTYYTDFSLWDTFRTLHPWLTLVFPEFQRDFVGSLMQMARDGGAYPRWPLGIGYTGGMIGDAAPIVIADSAVKGLDGFDVTEAYALAKLTADGPPPASAFSGRSGIEDYLSLGYVPIEASGSSTSWTLEVAHSDYAVGELAAAAGDDAGAATYRERAHNYQNSYDAESGFFLGRFRDGSFDTTDFDPFVWQDYYAEGNAWQYNWYAPHDLEGMADLFGGRDATLARLDMFFDQSMRRMWLPLGPDTWYWHGNEPDIHVPWIYVALDRPARTAEVNRWIVDTRYDDAPQGIPGNDDSGTLSAWYTFTTLGLFPLPALDYYLVSGPQLTRAVVHLEGGDLVIEAPEASAQVIYVESATLDGAPLDRARVSHADIADGATLHFEMSETPTDWATH